jgi:RNA polymerase primary sigma factor
MVEKLNKVVHSERRLVQQLARDPSAGEIAAEAEMTTEEVREILRMARPPLSLERPIGEEQEAKLGDFVEDEAAESALETAAVALRRRDLRRVLSSLPERERRVIELRYGLDRARPCTLEEVGQVFGLTRERIRRSKTTPSPSSGHCRRRRRPKTAPDQRRNRRAATLCAHPLALSRQSCRPLDVADEPKGDMHLCKARTFEASRGCLDKTRVPQQTAAVWA